MMAELELSAAQRMSIIVVRELGNLAFLCLIMINAAGALVCFALGQGANFFVAGLLFAFAGVLITYVMASASVVDPEIHQDIGLTVHLLLMVGPPFVSLMAFVLGVAYPMVAP